MSRSAIINPCAGALLALAGCMGTGGSSDEVAGASWSVASDPAAAEPNATRKESAEARALVEAIRTRFGTTIQQGHLQHPDPMADLLAVAPLPEAAPEILVAAPGTSIARQGAFLRPDLPPLPRRSLAHRVEVLLPIRAGGAFQVKDTATGMAIEIGLTGAADAPGEVADGFVVYRRAAPSGGDILHRPVLNGTEDYLHFDHPPDEPALRYEVALNEHVAGLRLVSNTLEFLDATGAPRLRMAPPWGIDSTGQRFEAIPTVEGCVYDSDPRGPWGRPVASPAAARCTVHVQWDGAGVHYPALVDPMWMSTSDMTAARNNHAASVLVDGRVLVAGGTETNVGWLNSVELYDPATDTWAMTGSMNVARAAPAAALLADYKVLIAGGRNGPTFHASAEIYDPATGMWSLTTTPMSAPRQLQGASLLANGKVLVAGGTNGSTSLDTSEIYDPAAGTWSLPIKMSATRYAHAQVVLADGTVLVLGGADSVGSLKSADVYDPAANTWTATEDMAFPHHNTTASLLPNGKVLVVGGVGVMFALTTTELYDPVQRQFSDAAAADLSTVRYSHTANVLASGKVIVTGGLIGGQAQATAELYDPARDLWSPVESMGSARYAHTATVLANGKVLVAGGNIDGQTTVRTAELFLLLPGDTCTAAQDCGSGICAGGVCCNSECASTCQNGLLDTAVCDSNGDCQHPAKVTCFPYACDGTTACKTSCAADIDCAPGFQCNAGNGCIPRPTTCIDNQTLQNIDGTTIDCTPYRCEGHACLQICMSANDCIAPTVCDALSKQCIAPGTGNPEQAGGCTLTTPAPTRAASLRWLAAIAAAGWLARRRAAPSAMTRAAGRPRRTERCLGAWNFALVFLLGAPAEGVPSTHGVLRWPAGESLLLGGLEGFDGGLANTVAPLLLAGALLLARRR